MKYYIIAGEASGDLHASNLMKEILSEDKNAEFRFYGGDKMEAVGGTLVKHYSNLAYMGFITVALHSYTILKLMKECKNDILFWRPDAIILVDYPGFNLQIAEWANKVRKDSDWQPKIFYYISPKIWAWKEYRINSIKQNIDEIFSILPFEEKWYAERGVKVNYVGNPCLDAINDYFADGKHESDPEIEEIITARTRGIIAILAGSRKQEIKSNLKLMLEGAHRFEGYKLVIAAAPNIEESFYRKYIPKEYSNVRLVFGKTYDVLKASTAALVTSGTATLETAILRVPQVVCYRMPMSWFYGALKSLALKVKFISLVNLIATREVVKELVASDMTPQNAGAHLLTIMPGGIKRQKMLRDYDDIIKALGEPGASKKAAKLMVEILQRK